MMYLNIYLNKLEVSNFRSFKPDNIKIFEFDDVHATIFDGPNGYGKSTVFDAIELMLMGNINHFNDTLKNGHKTGLSIIANDDQVPTEIQGTFKRGAETFQVKKVLNWTDSTNSKLLHIENGQERNITETELYDLLNISKNFFNVGMYISQSESLQFLQEKYKKRKEILTSILELQDLNRKIEFVKKIKESFSAKHKKLEEFLKIKKIQLENHLTDLEKQLTKIESKDGLILFNRLFPEKQFIFDEEKIDIAIPYEKTVRELELIKMFIDNYSFYEKSKSLYELDSLKKFSKLQLKRYYYRTKKDYFENEEKWMRLISISKQIKNQNITKDFLEEPLILSDQSVVDDVTSFFDLENRRDSLIKQASEGESVVLDINKKRAELHQLHGNQDIIQSEDCPFCGSHIPKLEDAYQFLTQEIEKHMDDQQKQIDGLEKQILKQKNIILDKVTRLFSSLDNELAIFNEIKNEKLPNKSIIDLFNSFIPDFSNSFVFINDYNFDTEYESIMNKLDVIRGNDTVMSNKDISKYNNIFKEAFNNIKPEITIDEIENKFTYIESKYRDKYLKEIQGIKVEIGKVNGIIKKLENEGVYIKEILETIQKIIENSFKKFQTKFIQKIQLPLFIISGRIIQTYQLGLGIYVDVNDTQVVFKANNKNTDIFNIMSVGQLNGVILSLLLSIRKIYEKENQLNLILIDDPLQSIDELSAHSFADLLSEEFTDSQIILSTHEDDKSRLIRYKYNQVGKKTQNYNMQLEYLK